MAKRSGRVWLTIALAITLNAATVMNGQSTSGARSTQAQVIGVPGASNSTPSLAAAGLTVAVVWTATKDGRSNVYVAMSGDGVVRRSRRQRASMIGMATPVRPTNSRHGP
jgi:hypothetical protein